MVHRTNLQMRFSDTDALGHVNNIAFASYAETGRVDFMQRVGKSIRSLILANISIDYRKQIALGDEIAIDTWVESLGRSSITLSQKLWANGELAADIRSVAVHFDYKVGKPAPLTDEIRAALESAGKPADEGRGA
jgi:acyl-CoA thioester hydrolase